MITTINEWQNNTLSIVEQIKLSLIDDDDISWEEFIDNQELGDCQGIVSSIKLLNLPDIQVHFGEISINEPLDEDDFDRIMTHHWVSINNLIYEFSKGTLKDYVDFNDLYSCENDGEIEYNMFR